MNVRESIERICAEIPQTAKSETGRPARATPSARTAAWRDALCAS
jgi:hypothetical protein